MKEFVGALTGYQYDPVTGQVFSSKRSGLPVPMKWQDGPSGRYVYLTKLNGDRYRLTALQLTTSAYNEMLFGKQQYKAKVMTTTNGFIVGSVDGTAMSISQTPKVHPTEHEARTEAERLAKSLPGKTFIVMELKGRVRAGGVTWE